MSQLLINNNPLFVSYHAAHGLLKKSIGVTFTNAGMKYSSINIHTVAGSLDVQKKGTLLQECSSYYLFECESAAGAGPDHRVHTSKHGHRKITQPIRANHTAAMRGATINQSLMTAL